MKRIGLIAGTVFLDHDAFPHAEPTFVATPFGPVGLVKADPIVYVPRHGLPGSGHVLPHQINHSANLTALKQLGVSEIIAVGSTGGLKKDIEPGSLVIPDDFIALFASHTTAAYEPIHALPVLDQGVRANLLVAAKKAEVEVIDGGIYFQTTGPRLETRAEVAMIAGFADVVGMTVGSEAGVAAELEIPFAALCSVDNFAHGIVDEPLSLEIIQAKAQKNAESILRIIENYPRP